jgi:DNA-binding GntR family transcriptional regulator
VVGESLVTSEEQRGFRVAPASLDDFRDLTEVRILNEGEALRQSIAAGNEAWESNLFKSFYRLSKVEERRCADPEGTLSEFEKRHHDFHHALLADCPSRWLHQMVGLLLQQSERYRRMAISRRTTPRDVHAEHRAIFDAAIACDADLACKLNAEHIGRTLTVLRAVLELDPAERALSKGEAKRTN